MYITIKEHILKKSDHTSKVIWLISSILNLFGVFLMLKENFRIFIYVVPQFKIKHIGLQTKLSEIQRNKTDF